MRTLGIVKGTSLYLGAGVFCRGHALSGSGGLRRMRWGPSCYHQRHQVKTTYAELTMTLILTMACRSRP
jgi:hypothetical protein